MVPVVDQRCHHDPVPPDVPRFLRLPDVAEILNISMSQAYALVRSGDLRYIPVGGRNQIRVEASELEAYIQRMYAKADKQGSELPLEQ